MAKYVGNGRWSGKVGAWVLCRNGRHRRYARHAAPQATPQEQMRRRLKALAAKWGSLLPSERDRWNRTRAARRASWSGYTAFVAAGLRRQVRATSR